MAEIEITAMTLGPYGVGRLDGRTVMVANAAPGDLLEVAIESERRDYAMARVARVIRPGLARRAAPCKFLPRCGGCDWQHIEYAAQVRSKGELIAADFGRALGIQLDAERLVEPASSEFGYRSRIRLKIGVRGAVGFHELHSNVLVEIDRCLVAADGLLMPTRLAAAPGRRCAEIEVVHDQGRNILVAHLLRAPGADEVARARHVIETEERIAGIVLRSGTAREAIGETGISVEVEPGLVLKADADLFSQVNREQNRKLVAHVMATAAITGGTRVLDLFCGAGNLSLPVARRGGVVTGVDADGFAIEAAARNASRLGFGGAQFVAMKAAETARFLERARYRPEVVIIDPPRSGALDLMDLIARLGPKRFVYVSCDASTLVRDLRAMIVRNYRIEQVKAFDFFPNTHHVEIAVLALLT